jgi:PAS domain S-box-containing protein
MEGSAISDIKSRPIAVRYAMAILAAAAALLLRKILSPWLGPDNPYLPSWAAIVFSAWYCGIGPSVACVLVSLVGVWYWFLPYFRSFVLQYPRTEISGMLLFSVLAGFIVALGEANRRSKAASDREVTERRRIEDELRKTQEELESRVRERTTELDIAHQELSREAERVKAQSEWLDAANDAIFVGDADEKITYWNRGAERLYGWSREEAIGKPAHSLLQTDFPIPFAEIATQRREGGWQGELVHARQDGSKVTVASRWTALTDADNNLAGWLEINRDITDRKAAEGARQLSAQLLKTRDDEHRRIARELHDNAGQMVIALILNLGQLKPYESLRPEQTRILSDSDTLLQNLSSELRAISHLLHPPLLDEVGLWTALEWYVEGFSRRSGIATTLERDSSFGRLTPDLEIAIFRVVQECLTNVDRHSGSKEAAVRLLRRSQDEVWLEVRDRGKGISPETQLSISEDGSPGVGLRGMRERVLQLGGNLRVESDGSGTTIAAAFPTARGDAPVNEPAAA